VGLCVLGCFSGLGLKVLSNRDFRFVWLRLSGLDNECYPVAVWLMSSGSAAWGVELFDFFFFQFFHSITITLRLF